MPEPITLDGYLDAVTTAIGAVTGVGTCRCDGLLEEDAAAPIVLVDPQRYEPLEELGPDRWYVQLIVELVVLVRRSTRGARRAALATAHAVAVATRWQTWGVAAGPAEVVSVYHDDSEPFGEAWEVVRVEYVQPVVWIITEPDDEPAITTVYAGESPNIGAAHVEDYVEVVPGD